MASLGRKLFFGLITILLGVFAVFPLFVFAVFTFWIAICFLVFLVLFKGIGAIWRSLLQWRNTDDRNSPEAIARRERLADQARRIARARSSSASQSSNTPTRSQSNRSNRSNSNVSLASLPQPDRDYEGTLSHMIPHTFLMLTHTQASAAGSSIPKPTILTAPTTLSPAPRTTTAKLPCQIQAQHPTHPLPHSVAAPLAPRAQESILQNCLIHLRTSVGSTVVRFHHL